MKDTRDLQQVFRIDGKGCFMEVMLSGLPLDKVLLRFMQYDLSRQAGQRVAGNVAIYLGVFEAARLSRDIMSGRIAALGKASKGKAKESGSRYPAAVFESLGGTPSKYAADGKAVARQFSIAPGAAQPWILCAKQGDAHETKEGLIVMDGAPKVTIRVPCSGDALKELALALETAYRVWEHLRFIPAVAPAMAEAQRRREEAIDKAKSTRS